jgi:ribosome maturation factor RimP
VTLVEPAEDGRKQVKAVLAGIDGDMVLFDDKKAGRLAFAFSAIASAKLVLTDALISATTPLSLDGADDIQTEAQED